MIKVKHVLFLVIVLLCGRCWANDLVGRGAPEITIREWVTKDSLDLKSLKGKVYVLEFWATWCYPCVDNIPHFMQICSKYKPMGVEFIALSQDKSFDKVQKFVVEKGINYHVAIDNGTADWYDIKCYPTVVVIDHTGKVTWNGLPWESGFERAIAEATAKASVLLQGFDLGPFSYLRSDLMGGSGFAGAYHTIKSAIFKADKDEASNIATQIILAIDQGISKRIDQAERLQEKYPLQAYKIYADLVANYGGVAVVKPAKAAYLKLKSSAKVRKLLENG